MCFLTGDQIVSDQMPLKYLCTLMAGAVKIYGESIIKANGTQLSLVITALLNQT